MRVSSGHQLSTSKETAMKAANVCLALLLAPASAGLLSLSGCGTTPSTPAQKAALADEGQLKLKELYAENPDLKTTVENAYGYCIFPDVSKGGLVIEGGSGRGSVYEQGRYIGTAGISMGGVGADIGGQSYTELLVFATKDALSSFEDNKLQFDASASAVALKAGAADQAKWSKGVAVFTKPIGGFMLEAAIGGQQFTFKAAQIAPSTAPTLSSPATQP
jgi:lipid-binding SYLF domain-containing protein